MSLACYLWYREHRIMDRRWQNGLCSWLFQDSPRMESDIEEFYAGEARVNPREYFNKMTEFKRDMYKDRPS